MDFWASPTVACCGDLIVVSNEKAALHAWSSSDFSVKNHSMRLQQFQGLGHLGPVYQSELFSRATLQNRYFNAFKSTEKQCISCIKHMMFLICLMQEWSCAHLYIAESVRGNLLHTARAIPGLGLTLAALNSVICKTGLDGTALGWKRTVLSSKLSLLHCLRDLGVWEWLVQKNTT